jgi:hypothetical protein
MPDKISEYQKLGGVERGGFAGVCRVWTMMPTLNGCQKIREE